MTSLREKFEAWYIGLMVQHGFSPPSDLKSLEGEHGDYREHAFLHGCWMGYQGAVKARNPSPEDFIVWPDGFSCERSELSQFNHRSDDYELVRAGSGVHQLLSDLMAPAPTLDEERAAHDEQAFQDECMMTVEIDGQHHQRRIDHMDHTGQQVPALFDGEEAMYTLDGAVIIIRTHVP